MKALINIQERTITIDGETCSLVEAGLHVNTDDDGYRYEKDTILDALRERYDDIEIEFALTKERIMTSSNLIATVAMVRLIDLGWDFTGDYDHETSPRKEFDKWVDNCNVQIFFRNGRSQYVIQEYQGPQKGWTDWAELPTGDDDKTADDILELYESGNYITIEDDDDYPR